MAVTATATTKVVLRVQLAEQNMILGRTVRQRRFELGEMVVLYQTLIVEEYETMDGLRVLAL